ncbi:MerR family transcriptional regulator [Alkalicoccobacillus gibsonii]|uniref:MerR family transcriptional regulator n=1 Tax=Alkalicoccobacillus gibsonii TaxID=79881 RepID=UPI003516FD45
MKNHFDKVYLTGEFAKLLEVNKDTLFYYDKINLFKPAGTLDNGYRYYTFDQFDQFVAIQLLRTAELSIKELKTYFDKPNVQALQQLATKQQENVANEIRKLQDVQFFLERTVSLTKELEEAPIDEILIKHVPEELVVYSEEKINWMAPIDELYEKSTRFLKKLGMRSNTSYGIVYAKEDYLNELSEGTSRLFCRLDDPSAKMKPEGDYAIIYQKGFYDDITETLETLIEHLDNEQLEVDGDIYEEYLLHSIAVKNDEDYITKISVRVKPK